MKAISIHQYGGPEVLGYGEAPQPTAGKGQVLVRVQAASVNPIDYKLVSGAMKAISPLEFPWIPGGDFSGIIEAIGAGVTEVKQGDSVYGHSPGGGAYAQFVVASAAMVSAKPAKLSYVEASSVPLAGQTAWQGLFDQGHLQKGQTVLIHGGSGGVGTFAVQLARWKGARVLATGSSSNAEYLRSLGADQVIDYKATPFESVAKDVDVVLDLIGGETHQRSYTVLRRGGYLISTVQPPSEEEARRHGVQALVYRMQPSRAILEELAKLLDDSKIKVVVTKTYPLSQAQEAWAQIMSKHTRGKIVLEVPGQVERGKE